MQRKNGNLAESYAQVYYQEQGYTVSLPVSENQKYDLIVERDGVCERVQVKYTSQIADSGNPLVDLRTNSPNGNTVKRTHYKEGDFDRLFVMSPVGFYDLRSEKIKGRSYKTVQPESKCGIGVNG